MNNIMDGIIDYTKKEIERRLKKEAEKVVAGVIMDAMCSIRIEQHDPVDRLRTEIVFIFEKGKDNNAKPT
jgi:hypothetical protein